MLDKILLPFDIVAAWTLGILSSLPSWFTAGVSHVLWSLLAFYILWVFYLALMNLKRVRDLGQLSTLALRLGTPRLIVGYLLDAVLNIVPMSFIMLEFPRELTISQRLKRHITKSRGWRQSLALWFEPLLDPFDPSGNHI